MASVQLSFSLRTSSSVKTVHLLGSWDGYAGQLPLSKEKNSTHSWKSTFRFQGGSIQPGQRYWYYYIIDGYHVSHDPSEDSTTEPTTGRVLNILDVPCEKSSSKHSSSKHSSSKTSSSKHSSSRDKHSSRRESRRVSNITIDIPKGRPLSESEIVSPKPVNPHATKLILEGDYAPATVEELTQRFAAADIDDYDSDELSPPSSVGSSLSSRSDSSSPSSASSLSDYSSPNTSNCTCERYGLTRKGERIRLDCGGTICRYSDDSSSSCCSDEEEYVPSSSRRHGVVVRR